MLLVSLMDLEESMFESNQKNIQRESSNLQTPERANVGNLIIL